MLQWLASLLTQGKDTPVIMKALVELDGPRSQPFKAFAEQREKWMVHDMYRAPGKRDENTPHYE